MGRKEEEDDWPHLAAADLGWGQGSVDSGVEMPSSKWLSRAGLEAGVWRLSACGCG